MSGEFLQPFYDTIHVNTTNFITMIYKDIPVEL
jgi:hypothetical protein